MPRPMDHGYPVNLERQCEAKVKNSYRRCKKPTLVGRHFAPITVGLPLTSLDFFKQHASGPFKITMPGTSQRAAGWYKPGLTDQV